jgi:hypothetical protein
MNEIIWESSIIRAWSSQHKQSAKTKKRFKSTFAKTHAHQMFREQDESPKVFVFETQKGSNRLDPSTEVSLNLRTFEGPEPTDRLCTLEEKPCLENYLKDSKEEKSKFIVHTFARPKGLVAIKARHAKDVLIKPATPTPTMRLGLAGWKLVKPKSSSRPVDFRENVKIRNKFLEIVSKKIW